MLSLYGNITHQGLELNKEDIINKYQITGYKKLLKKFIIRYKSPIGTFYIEKKNYIIKNNTLILPRFAAEDLINCKIINDITNSLSEGVGINFSYTGEPTYNQQIIINHIFNNIYTDNNKLKGFCGLTLNAQAGCHIKDTKIIMFDGTIKMVQDIKIGDILMGDDSTPRHVLKLCRGKEMMYEISNKNNESYIVNENHILALICTRQKKIYDNYKKNQFLVKWFDNTDIKMKSKIFSYKNKKKEEILSLANIYLNNIEDNLKVDITVKEYINLPINLQKILCGYKSSITFPKIELPIDPYIIGYCLGNKNMFKITFHDSSIIEYFQNYLEQYNCYLLHENNNIYTINAKNSDCNYFINNLKKINNIIFIDNIIPHIYKCNSKDNQLKLLAGIIDSIGHLNKKYEFEIKKHSNIKDSIIDDIIYLCRSLGLYCYKNIKYIDYKGIIITGNSIIEIPTLSQKKQTKYIPKHRNLLIYNIKIKKLKIDNYYGFQLDGNHRYIMDDFTILHNSGKSFLAMNIINKLKLKTLIIVPNTYLLNQWVDLLSKFFPNNKIGQYYGKKKEDGDIIVAIINSLVNDEYVFDEVIKYNTICNKIKCDNIAKYNFEDEFNPLYCTKHKCKNMIKVKNKKIIKNYIEFFKEFGFVILDESHIYCTDSFKIVYNRCQSTYMLGLSATPNERDNNCDLISHLNIGKVLKADDIEGYKKYNVKFNASVVLLKYNAPDEYVNTHINDTTKMICVPRIIEDIINDPYRNQLIIDQLLELFYLKLNIFVFSERRSHLEYLYELFNKTITNINIEGNLSIPELNINNNIVLYGNSSDDDVNIAKKYSNVIFTTYAYSSTGVSINRMTGLILASPRRSKSIQIIGRIFRLDDTLNHLHRHIIDIVDNKSVLKNQVYERMKAYKDRDCIIQKKEIDYNNIII